MHSFYAPEPGNADRKRGTLRADPRPARRLVLALAAGGGVALALAGAATLPFVGDLGDGGYTWFVEKAVGRIDENLRHLIGSPLDPGDRFCLVYLAAFVIFGAAIWMADRRHAGEPVSLLGFLFPRAVYRHRSAAIDVGVFLINRVFSPAVLITRLVTGAWLAAAITGGLTALFGAHERVIASATADIVVFTLLTLLAYDFSDWLSHALLHRVPVLWQFHRLHHSAEVLMPLTVARVHPVEQVVGTLVATPVAAIVTGVAGYFFLEQPTPLSFLGAQASLVLFFAAGYHLRHSHVWLHWGPVLGCILISPAQHQIHHSCAPQHHDRNYGYIFAFWDWMFGTLYLPRRREALTFGLYGEPRGAVHTSLWQAYVEPFKGAAALLLRRQSGEDAGRR